MAEQKSEQRPHFVLANTARTEHFRSTVSGSRETQLPNLDRQAHGHALLGQIAGLKTQSVAVVQTQRDAGIDSGFGIQIQFKSQPDVELAFESLSRERQRIELLNVRRVDNATFATVFVPDGKLDAFEKLIEDYLAEKQDAKGRHRDNKALLNTIQEVRAATFDALWTDDPAVLPADENQVIWWEIWLPVRDDRTATLARFRTVATGIGFVLSTKVIQFPERTVLHMRGSKRQIIQSMQLLNNVAEIRVAKETAEFFDGLTPPEQHEWVENLLNRTTFAAGQVPYVCLLDTGVNRGHPLLAPGIDVNDMHTYEPAWGPQDDDGHGTQMAGIALYGDLTEPMASNAPMLLGHRLESVKLIRDDHTNQGEPYGEVTIEAVGRPEVTAPDRRRVFSMAVTAKDNRDRGRPSAWSAAIDSLACDVLGEGLIPRLMVISAGNIDDLNAWRHYPDSNITDGIHDPGQSWNALTVGAYTRKINITEADAQAYQPIAPADSLSPFSTTSVTWQGLPWPYKPDVVFEGGNAAQDAISPATMPSLSLLTTHHVPNQRLLTTANATSAASALCSRMAAQIMAQYPNLWPETVRALMVHSADWTAQMQADFLDARKRKEDYARLIRHCGYGVPDLDRALWSLSNSLTLIVQDSLQPFQRDGSREPTARDMHVHLLPWPKESLMDLGQVQVEMRVTLSYFVEPNPGVVERGTKGRYRYESHGLRFDVKRPAETEQTFRARINLRARDEEEGSYQGGSTDPNWRLGIDRRTWTGTAADLAERGVLAVYPSLGWWKTAKKLERYNNRARYALVVSISAPEVTVDLYNVIAQAIATPITVTVGT
ncbi:MAG: S8 family peptidase [Proteobacteria bacterium]|nr:S8 family peptidase [Pseudomonadota bacterium]